MSFQDRLASQDASQLLLLGSSLSMVTMSAQKGIYNFPLFLFGIIAHEMHSSTVPFKQFLSLVVFSGIFDLLRLPSWSLFSISSIFAFLVLLLKIPVFLTCLAQLRERGGDLRFGYPNFQGLQSGAQNWTMPGPFGNAGAGQTTGSTAAPPGSFPSGGGFRLGGEEEEGQQQQGQGGPPPGPAPGRNGYQTIA